MKLLLSVLVLVLVALSNAKPCSGPKCKRMAQYSDYDEYYNNVGDRKINQNGGYSGPSNGRSNNPSGGRPNGPTGGRPNGNNENRYSDCPNCYAFDFGNGDYNSNVINIEKK